MYYKNKQINHHFNFQVINLVLLHSAMSNTNQTYNHQHFTSVSSSNNSNSTSNKFSFFRMDVIISSGGNNSNNKTILDRRQSCSNMMMAWCLRQNGWCWAGVVENNRTIVPLADWWHKVVVGAVVSDPLMDTNWMRSLLCPVMRIRAMLNMVVDHCLPSMDLDWYQVCTTNFKLLIYYNCFV